MIFGTTSSTLEVFLGGAVTHDSVITLTYVDITPTTNVGLSAQVSTAGVTVTTILNAPPTGHQYQLTELAVMNADIAPIVITIQRRDGAVVTPFTFTLGVGYTLAYTQSGSWKSISPTGAEVMLVISLSAIAIGDTVAGSVASKILWVDGANTLQQVTLGSSLSITGSTLSVVSTPLTATYVGFGSGANVLTGNADLTYNSATKELSVVNEVITGYEDFTVISNPSTPAANHIRLWSNVTNGKENFYSMGSDGLLVRLGRDSVSTVRNTSGGPLVAGDVVYVTGATSVSPNVSKAKADSGTTMPSFGMVMEPIANNAYGRVLHYGRTEFGYNTTAFNVGDILYVSQTTAGTLTNVRPPHPNYNEQFATVLVKSANGSIFITDNDQQGFELGTNQNTFAIGDGLAGTKTLSFVNAFTGQLQWTPTAARTKTLQDSSGTIADSLNNLSFFAATTSAQLAGVISDETGTGALVFANTPTLVTPVLGAASATSLALTGTSGNGFISVLSQSSQPAVPASGFVMYANAADKIAFRKASDTYERSFAFGTLAADSVYAFPNASATMLYAGGALDTPSSGTLTNCTTATQAAGTNNTTLASTAYVDAIASYGIYKPLITAHYGLSATATPGTYYMIAASNFAAPAQGALTTSGTSTNGLAVPMLIYIASADYPTVNGLAPKLRIRANVFTNHTAPTGNFTFGLFPITRPASAGGAGTNIFNIGTVVSGSNGATFTTPAADSELTAVGSDFAFPADGWYAICVTTTGTIATNGVIQFSAQLQIHNA